MKMPFQPNTVLYSFSKKERQATEEFLLCQHGVIYPSTVCEYWSSLRIFTVVRLRKDGKTFSEIAKQFKITPARVSALFHKGIRLLTFQRHLT